ncbi:MAG: glycine cleavage system protein GcvH [Bacteroidetes bacterium]|nr:glycine cleavage system protein GcvH [Bacteroidota bacterium]
MNFPEDLKYTKDHEWIRLEDQGQVGIIGITDFAQSELGDIVYVELPSIGSAIHQGKAFGTIEAVKAVSDLFAPISGIVHEVNPTLTDHPEIINRDPYNEGWLIKVSVTNSEEISQLLDSAAYRAMIGK